MLHASILFALSLSSLASLVCGLESNVLAGHSRVISANDCQHTYLHANHRLFFLDNDGALLPPSPSNEDKVSARQALANLLADPKNKVWVTTSAPREELEALYGDLRTPHNQDQLRLETVSDDGLPTSYETRTQSTENLSTNSLERWCKDIPADSIQLNSNSIVFKHDGCRKGGQGHSIEGKKRAATPRPGYKFLDAVESAPLIRLPRSQQDLGTIVLEDYNVARVFAISMGGDVKHEPIHRAIKAHGWGKMITVFVNEDFEKPTEARSRLPNPQAVHEFLTQLVRTAVHDGGGLQVPGDSAVH